MSWTTCGEQWYFISVWHSYVWFHSFNIFAEILNSIRLKRKMQTKLFFKSIEDIISHNYVPVPRIFGLEISKFRRLEQTLPSKKKMCNRLWRKLRKNNLIVQSNHEFLTKLHRSKYLKRSTFKSIIKKTQRVQYSSLFVETNHQQLSQRLWHWKMPSHYVVYEYTCNCTNN